jgi:hypothetical protein
MKLVKQMKVGEVGHVAPQDIFTTGNQPSVFYVRSTAQVMRESSALFSVVVRCRHDSFLCSKLDTGEYSIGQRDPGDLPVLCFTDADTVIKGNSLPKLFVSFTSVLYALKNGRVTETDLQKGLFVFGCTRDHAINPGAQEEFVERVVKERPDIHQMLVKALLRAEADGRVNWRSATDNNVTYEMVDDLLVRNGYRQLMGTREYEEMYGQPFYRGHYNYPTVERCSLQLEVIH